jgi:hypothetical protein
MVMALVVGIHGISQEYEAEETLLDSWRPALCGGVSNAGGRLQSSDVAMAFYGILFRPGGKGTDIPNYSPGDVDEGLEMQLLESWADAAADQLDDSDPTKSGMLRRSASSMLQLLGRTPYFGDVAQKVVIWYLKQVRRYVSEPETRVQVQQRVLKAITENTRVLVGHSLGSVVAYEVLCAHPELPVRTLVTLGSPLGVPALLPRLAPPVATLPGKWPGKVRHWFNVADQTDVVALEKRLSTVYGPEVLDAVVHNGATMHNIKPYLTAVETGRAILAGLEGP